MLIDRVISLSTAAGVEPVAVQQHDRESRTVRFFVYESSGVPLDVQGKTARFFFRKNGATSKAYEADVAADGWISLTVPDAVTAIPGNGEMQLAIVDGSFILHSFTIPFAVMGSLSFSGETESPEDDPMRIAWDTLPGKPDTFPPSGHTHTPEQAGALPANGTAADAAKLGGKLPNAYTQAWDPVENGYFCRGINQRGKATTTAWGYCIDRWHSRITGITYGLSDEGLSLASDQTSNAYLYQKLNLTEAEWLGQTFTVALCDGSGNIACGSVMLPTAKPATWTTLLSPVYAGKAYAGLLHTGSDLCVSCGLSGGGSAVIRWVAVYKGEYTKDTLPRYIPKPDVVTLAQCHREYYRFQGEGQTVATGLMVSANKALFAIPLPQPMRVTPTVTAIGSFRVRVGNADYAAPASWQAVFVQPNVCLLEVTTAASHAVGTGAALYFDSASGFAFDATR